MVSSAPSAVRADCFKLLAVCFYQPDKTLFVEERVVENLLALLQKECVSAVPHAMAMLEGLQQLDEEQLSLDYAKLFLGPFALLAAPYGSVYTENSRRIMGDSTMAAMRCYQEAGLSVVIKEPPDHIAIELEFMSYLCSREALAIQDQGKEEAESFRSKQAEFYHVAMKPWVSQFCQAIRTGTENEFYHRLADCLDDFLARCAGNYPIPAGAE